MNQEFYHLAPIPLEAGSIIKPGNWGRLLQQYPSNSDVNSLQILLREQTFELIRHQGYLNKPSRYESIFLFPDIDGASAFHSSPSRKNHFMYKVRVLDSTKPIHIGEMPVHPDTTHAQYLWLLRQQATIFWSGEKRDGHIEAITESPVEIVELIGNQ